MKPTTRDLAKLLPPTTRFLCSKARVFLSLQDNLRFNLPKEGSFSRYCSNFPNNFLQSRKALGADAIESSGTESVCLIVFQNQNNLAFRILWILIFSPAIFHRKTLTFENLSGIFICSSVKTQLSWENGCFWGFRVNPKYGQFQHCGGSPKIAHPQPKKL